MATINWGIEFLIFLSVVGGSLLGGLLGTRFLRAKISSEESGSNTRKNVFVYQPVLAAFSAFVGCSVVEDIVPSFGDSGFSPIRKYSISLAIFLVAHFFIRLNRRSNAEHDASEVD